MAQDQSTKPTCKSQLRLQLQLQLQLLLLLLLLVSSHALTTRSSHQHAVRIAFPRTLCSSSLASTAEERSEETIPRQVVDDDIFGMEYRTTFAPTKTAADMAPTQYWKGKPYRQIQSKGGRGRVMKGFDQLRTTFLLDSLFVCSLGLSATWYFGTFRDVKSFALGSVLGLAYAVLLGRYVESVGGSGGQRGGGAGAARFAPVILLVALYGKYKTELAIIPELLGFFSYQAASLLQIWNESAYTEEGEGEGEGV